MGDLLENILGRHSWRPAHLHFKIDADGYQPLTTQLYFASDPATVWAWVDTSSEAVNAEYRDALIESARKDEQHRMLLLDALFEGRLGEWKMLGGGLPAIGLPERTRWTPARPGRTSFLRR